jgi:hypothetical protein
MTTATNAAIKAAGAATTADEQREPAKFVRRVGSTLFEVNVRFSAKTTETLQDKLLRVIEREAVMNRG